MLLLVGYSCPFLKTPFPVHFNLSTLPIGNLVFHSFWLPETVCSWEMTGLCLVLSESQLLFSHSVWPFAASRTVTRQAPLCPWGFPGKNSGAGCCFLLQGSNPHLLQVFCITGQFFTAEPTGKPLWKRRNKAPQLGSKRNRIQTQSGSDSRFSLSLFNSLRLLWRLSEIRHVKQKQYSIEVLVSI